MNIKRFYPALNLVLLASFIAGIAGYSLCCNAYYKRLSVISAVNQLEYIGTLPSIISKGDRVEAPMFQDDPVYKYNKNLKGIITGDLYEDNVSIRYVTISVYNGKSVVKLSELMDARVRQ
jgi:hypothetical protein